MKPRDGAAALGHEGRTASQSAVWREISLHRSYRLKIAAGRRSSSVAVISSPCSMYGHSEAEWKIWSRSEVSGGPSGPYEAARSGGFTARGCNLPPFPLGCPSEKTVHDCQLKSVSESTPAVATAGRTLESNNSKIKHKLIANKM